MRNKEDVRKVWDPEVLHMLMAHTGSETLLALLWLQAGRAGEAVRL